MRLHGRISTVGAASAAAVLAFAIAPAAGVAKSKKSKSKANLVSCVAKVAVEAPTSATAQDQVFPDQTPGTQWGTIHCGKGVGSGLEELSYTIPVSGDEVGSFVAYFKGATIRGKFDLVSEEGSLFGNGTTASFGYAAFAGPIKHISGTGSLASAKSTGALATCTSQDGVHFKCQEKL